MDEIVIKRANFEAIMKIVSGLREELEALQEELEILANKELVEKIEEGLKDVEEGRIYGLEEFRKVLDEETDAN